MLKRTKGILTAYYSGFMQDELDFVQDIVERRPANESERQAEIANQLTLAIDVIRKQVSTLSEQDKELLRLFFDRRLNNFVTDVAAETGLSTQQCRKSLKRLTKQMSRHFNGLLKYTMFPLKIGKEKQALL
ncbi:hypothetical protein LNP00_06385 [Fructobacillus sp. M158]|uniref:hypothetical protein n=1 Tax=Fructobacillus parabroussonetiae TaxID=2713174 RepID=UPI00200A12E5|nr:hypothetical protein [Fructobacillus parabroussonetiae]MCK8617980.1 hypothetical protein [Fructobacillus parabroussonetiae]